MALLVYSLSWLDYFVWISLSPLLLSLISFIGTSLISYLVYPCFLLLIFEIDFGGYALDSDSLLATVTIFSGQSLEFTIHSGPLNNLFSNFFASHPRLAIPACQTTAIQVQQLHLGLHHQICVNQRTLFPIQPLECFSLSLNFLVDF